MRTAAGCDQIARRCRSGCAGVSSACAHGRLRARWRRSALAQSKGLPQRVQLTTICDSRGYTYNIYSLKMYTQSQKELLHSQTNGLWRRRRRFAIQRYLRLGHSIVVTDHTNRYNVCGRATGGGGTLARGRNTGAGKERWRGEETLARRRDVGAGKEHWRGEGDVGAGKETLCAGKETLCAGKGRWRGEGTLARGRRRWRGEGVVGAGKESLTRGREPYWRHAQRSHLRTSPITISLDGVTPHISHVTIGPGCDQAP